MAVKRTIRKTIYREIRDSLKRFLSIAGIIALGSGFFTGLKVTNTAMIKTADEYLNDTNMYDFRLISTQGWDEDSVASMTEVHGVSKASGCVTQDFIATVRGSDIVLTAVMMTDGINGVELVSGRLPETPGECLIDSYDYGGFSTGEIIKVSTENDEDTLDSFALSEYTVVGTVSSPLYINFERGTSSVGSGSVAAFVIIPEEGFSTDYYTEIYLTVEDPGYIYSDEYEANTDAMTTILESASAAAAETRFEKIRNEALEELADGRAEYEDGLKEYEEGLQDYLDGLQEYNDGVEELERKRAEAGAGMLSGLRRLQDAEAEVNAAESELNAKREEYSAQKRQLETYIASLRAFLAVAPPETAAFYTEQLETMTANLALLDSALAQIDAGLAAVEDSRAEIAAGYSELEVGQNYAERKFAEAEAELEDAKKELEDAEAELEDAKKELEDAEAELMDAEKEIDELEPPETYVLKRDTNVGYVCFESDADIVSGIARVFPFFFFAVAALVCVTTMSRMVADERGQIGVLKALGYSESSIMSRYLIYSGSASLLGCAVGVTLGSYIFPKVIWQAYSIMYSMPRSISIVFDNRLMLTSCLSYLMLALLVTYLSCRRELKVCAAELIRPKSPPAGKRILLERIPFIWRRFSFFGKVSLRNVFRYTRRLVMMVLGIGGCTGLLLTGFGLNDSITHIADRQFNEIMICDAEVRFSCSMEGSDRESFMDRCGDVVSEAAFLYSSSVHCSTELTSGSVTLCAPESFEALESLVDFHLNGSRVPYPGDGECVISENLADRYGYAVGDVLSVTNGDMEELELQVSGIYENVIYSYIYAPYSSVSAQFSDTPIKLALMNLREDCDVHESGAVVSGAENVSSVQLMADQQSRVNGMLDSMKYVVALVIGCAAALAFIVLFNLTNINIQERIREIATIKVLGFRDNETGMYILRENLILTLCGCIAGIPMGIWLHEFVMNQIKIDMISFTVSRSPLSYGLSVLLTFVFTMIVNFIMMPGINRVNMAEALKGVE